ncbi:type VII secretion integral membrane protein EccD [Streptomyces bambusae]|uniref:type VII secretion integral membrane protein EccD n=1 Tax=Streptomyces bambusae TaxID=1550616 RepID=UPI001CFFB8F7|nr:type VII secretion integral membrane protein EccD [Streptomyces bambusae]MCB5169957.1 type VII secretion integral membrane protein EccD [Streptomyces bambusae]
MSTAATGYCRITVAAPDRRVDVALPEDLALADLYPELLRLTGTPRPADTPRPAGTTRPAATPRPATAPGHHLVRRDGRVLDADRSLAAQHVLDGEVLCLRPFAESLPPPVIDDVCDALAAGADSRRLWNDALLRTACLTAAAVLLALLAFVLWHADPRHDMHGPPGVLAAATGLLLTACAGVRARIHRDPGCAAALGLAALPHLLLAGAGILPPAPGDGPGRLQFLLGCLCVLTAAAALAPLTRAGHPPFTAAAVLAAAGALTAFLALTTGTTATGAAAVCAPAAIALTAFLPALAARAARLPLGHLPHEPRDPDAGHDPPGAPAGHTPYEPPDRGTTAPHPYDPAPAARAHTLLLALLAGTSATAFAACAVLGWSGTPRARALALATALALLLRARIFRRTAQVACPLLAGLAALAVLLAGLALHLPPAVETALGHGDRGPLDLRTVLLTCTVALAAALLTAAAVTVPRTGLSPWWGRLLDLAETALLLSLAPLALAVVDAYAAARALTG